MTDNNRPRTPNEEEIAAVLADARASDPSYSYSDYYYIGTSGDPEPQTKTGASGPSNLVPIPTNAPDILNTPEDFEGGDVVMYHHSEDNTWRAYPPAEGTHITELPEIERVSGELPEVTMERKRDRLRARGIRIIKRVKNWSVAPERAPPKVSRVTRIRRKLTMHRLRLDDGLEWD